MRYPPRGRYHGAAAQFVDDPGLVRICLPRQQFLRLRQTCGFSFHGRDHTAHGIFLRRYSGISRFAGFAGPDVRRRQATLRGTRACAAAQGFRGDAGRALVPAAGGRRPVRAPCRISKVWTWASRGQRCDIQRAPSHGIRCRPQAAGGAFADGGPGQFARHTGRGRESGTAAYGRVLGWRDYDAGVAAKEGNAPGVSSTP